MGFGFAADGAREWRRPVLPGCDTPANSYPPMSLVVDPHANTTDPPLEGFLGADRKPRDVSPSSSSEATYTRGTAVMTKLVSVSLAFVFGMFALTGASSTSSTRGKVDRFALTAVYVVTDGLSNAVRFVQQHL